jgi:hypothetical protein
VEEKRRQHKATEEEEQERAEADKQARQAKLDQQKAERIGQEEYEKRILARIFTYTSARPSMAGAGT